METEDTRFVAECTTYDFKRELDRKNKLILALLLK